jgi:hypothetical protein
VAGATIDATSARSAQLTSPYALARDPSGNIWIAESSSNGFLHRLSPDGVLKPMGQFVGMQGVIALADGTILLVISTQHYVCTYVSAVSCVPAAGTPGPLSSGGYAGDGGLAVGARLNLPRQGVADARNPFKWWVAEQQGHRVRMVLSDVISTAAGNGTKGFSGDGGPATAAMLDTPSSVSQDADGHLYIADTGNHRIR